MDINSGAYFGICSGGLTFFLLPWGGGSAPFVPESPLKSIDFTGPGGGLSPHSPHPEYATSVNQTCRVNILKLREQFL